MGLYGPGDGWGDGRRREKGQGATGTGRGKRVLEGEGGRGSFLWLVPTKNCTPFEDARSGAQGEEGRGGRRFHLLVPTKNTSHLGTPGQGRSWVRRGGRFHGLVPAKNAPRLGNPFEGGVVKEGIHTSALGFGSVHFNRKPQTRGSNDFFQTHSQGLFRFTRSKRTPLEDTRSRPPRVLHGFLDTLLGFSFLQRAFRKPGSDSSVHGVRQART